MSDIVIRTENLGKRYRLGHTVDLRRTFAQALAELPRRFGRQALRALRRMSTAGDGATPSDHIWALRDFNLEVRRGEVVGIIGRNGAGKSTLLKILSRITDPTTGRAEIRGRLASLLEVGTGFHAELTGRENIYLNGTILGMKKAEIDARFDEIVAFAEVGQFLETPVKRYSSGMYVRLAFAVAAHIQPEILIVDEVLAVGDAAFQKRCLGRMSSAAREGRTVLFVSHNMAAVENLCGRSYLLADGRTAAEGPTSEVIEAYLSSIKELAAGRLDERSDRSGNGRLRFTAIRLESGEGRPVEILTSGTDAQVVLTYEAESPLNNVSAFLGFYGTLGQFLVLCGNEMTGRPFERLPPRGELRCVIPRLPLAAGVYNLNLYCEVNGVQADWIQQAGQITVVEGDFFGTGKHPAVKTGSVLVPHDWRATGIDQNAGR